MILECRHSRHSDEHSSKTHNHLASFRLRRLLNSMAKIKKTLQDLQDKRKTNTYYVYSVVRFNNSEKRSSRFPRKAMQSLRVFSFKATWIHPSNSTFQNHHNKIQNIFMENVWTYWTCIYPKINDHAHYITTLLDMYMLDMRSSKL